MNIDPVKTLKALEYISKNGISSALAVLFCIFIYYNQKDIQNINIEQGKTIVELRGDVEQLQLEQANMWKLYNAGLSEKTIFVSKLYVLEEQIRELKYKR